MTCRYENDKLKEKKIKKISKRNIFSRLLLIFFILSFISVIFYFSYLIFFYLYHLLI